MAIRGKNPVPVNFQVSLLFRVIFILLLREITVPQLCDIIVIENILYLRQCQAPWHGEGRYVLQGRLWQRVWLAWPAGLPPSTPRAAGLPTQPTMAVRMSTK